MYPRFRSRLIVAIILLVIVCSAFSVSHVVGFRLENRDGDGTEAALAEALVLQQSTKIKDEFLENLTVYIDSRNEIFEQETTGHSLGLYVPEDNAIYIRSDHQPERADDVFAEQVGYRTYQTMGVKESAVFPALAADPGPYLTKVVGSRDNEETEADIFAHAFMLYYISPILLEEESPDIYAYLDMLTEYGGDVDEADDHYVQIEQ